MTQHIPSVMHAVQLDKPGGRLTLREMPMPHPGANQVLVRMAAAPFNPSDLATLQGLSYGRDRKYPCTPGNEGSGVVVEAGTGFMPRLLMGRRVACSVMPTGQGTYAEYMVTSANLCVPLIRKVSLEQGAMMLVNPLTALAFFDIARQGRYRAMVSTAAASALGGMILRLGRRYGIPIIHIVRSQEQVDLVRASGGEYVLNSEDKDFVGQLRATAHELQATLFLDAIGGKMTGQLIEAAPNGSTLLFYSCLSYEKIETDPLIWLAKDLHAHGWLLTNWLASMNLVQTLLIALKVQSLLGTDLRSRVHKRLPLSSAQQGLAAYVQNMTAGKILLVANPQEIPPDAI